MYVYYIDSWAIFVLTSAQQYLHLWHQLSFYCCKFYVNLRHGKTVLKSDHEAQHTDGIHTCMHMYAS